MRRSGRAPYDPQIGRAGSGSRTATDEWLSSAEAATHLDLTVNALHKLTAARVVPFEQEGAGCKLWFRRNQFDAWRSSGEWRRDRPQRGVE
jgi:hypothetical protein